MDAAFFIYRNALKSSVYLFKFKKSLALQDSSCKF